MIHMYNKFGELSWIMQPVKSYGDLTIQWFWTINQQNVLQPNSFPQTITDGRMYIQLWNFQQFKLQNIIYILYMVASILKDLFKLI